ncbi:PH domain-containing protein [Fodinicola acaciae]|uniref:PH domain-containing protein n=1 Tax=Fodinicola acaciae TaxID=2681555 RepID=UPI0013D10BA8|nr:PH domain-containing protein [Fodinicola acaciae]
MDNVTRWRVPTRYVVLKAAVTVAFAATGLLLGRGDRIALILTVSGTAALLAYALRDLLAPVRLSADGAGVRVVSGYCGHLDVPWSRVERIRVDERRRLGLRTETLEIDTGERLHLFSAGELGADCADVADQLTSLRTGR